MSSNEYVSAVQQGTSELTSSAQPSPDAIPFELMVTAVQDLSPNFRRITLGGTCLRDFGVHGELLDIRIKLVCPPSGMMGWVAPPLDPRDPDWYGQWRALDPVVRGHLRTYSIRAARLDAAYPEIDIDFVLHAPAGGEEPGPAYEWATRASVGERITIIGPNNRGSHCLEKKVYGGIEWQPGMAQRVLLAGDETAVPAMAAILESLPAYMSGHAYLEVPTAADFQDIRTKADVQITWLARGAQIGRSRAHGEALTEAVRRTVPLPGAALMSDGPAGAEPNDVNVDEQILWDTPAMLDEDEVQATRVPDAPAGALPFYAWVAGEAGVIKEIRRYLVRDAGLDRKQVAFMGYWRQGRTLD